VLLTYELHEQSRTSESTLFPSQIKVPFFPSSLSDPPVLLPLPLPADWLLPFLLGFWLKWLFSVAPSSLLFTVLLPLALPLPFLLLRSTGAEGWPTMGTGTLRFASSFSTDRFSFSVCTCDQK
jgi:hypothetical protein